MWKLHLEDLRLPASGLLLASIAAIAGCAPDAGPDVEVAVDGVPVEIEEPAALSIGVVEGIPVEELHDVAAPSLLEDGSVVVPLRGENEIRVFGPDGEFVQALGGPGEGPGEFQRLSAAWSRGDTIEAWDSGPARITRFLPAGDVETIALVPGDEMRSRPSSFVGATRDGWLLLAVTSPGMEEGDRDQLVVHHFGRDGSALEAEIATIEGMDRGDFGRFTGPLPLSPAARFAFRSTGDREELYIAETLTPRIEVRDSRGESIRTIEWEPERTWAPEDAYARMVEATASDFEESLRQREGTMYAEGWQEVTRPPEAVPVFSDFMVDEEGFVWIRPFIPERDAVALGGNVGAGRSGAGGEWEIFSPEGARVGAIVLPDGFEPYQITSDRVVGIYRDELDVEFVRGYALTRQGR